MATYDRSQFVTNTPMEEVLFDFLEDQNDFIADKVFTPKPVKKSDNKVYQADTSKLRLIDTEAATNGTAKLITEQLFARNFTLVEHKAGAEINPRDQRDADIPYFFTETRKAKIATRALLMKRESIAASLATTAGNYPAALTTSLSAGSRWDDTGDPETQKQTADQALLLKSGIKRANAVAFDIATLRKLRTNAKFISRTQYTYGKPLDLDIFKMYLDVDYIFVAGGVYDSANEGATPNIGSFWGKDALFFYYNPSNGIEDVSFGHMYMVNTAIWQKTILDESRNGVAGSIRRVEVGTEYLLDKGFVESSSSNKFSAGYLYKNVIS